RDAGACRLARARRLARAGRSGALSDRQQRARGPGRMRGWGMSLRKMLRAGALALAVAPLGACALVNVAGEPAPNLYVLTAATPQAPEGAASATAQVVVETFSAPAAVD